MEVRHQEGIVLVLDEEAAAARLLERRLIAEELAEASEVLRDLVVRQAAEARRRLAGHGDAHGHDARAEAIDDVDGVAFAREQGARFVESGGVLGDDGRAKADRRDSEGHSGRGHGEQALGERHDSILCESGLNVCS